MGHQGSKASRVTFLGKDNRLMTTGFSRMSERQYAIWETKDLSKPLKMEMIDTGSGVLFPFFDPSTNMIYLAGKVGMFVLSHFPFEGDSSTYLFLRSLFSCILVLILILG